MSPKCLRAWPTIKEEGRGTKSEGARKRGRAHGAHDVSGFIPPSHARSAAADRPNVQSMQINSQQFKRAASQKLADPKVQKALKNAKGKLVVARAKSILELDNYEEMRDEAARIRDYSLLNLEVLLEEWEKNAKAAGTIVHWAETPQD